MENFNQIFTLLAEEEGINLNLDILETGHTVLSSDNVFSVSSQVVFSVLSLVSSSSFRGASSSSKVDVAAVPVECSLPHYCQIRCPPNCHVPINDTQNAIRQLWHGGHKVPKDTALKRTLG
jgi:hypothetical protein